MGSKIILTGKKFRKLTVLKEVEVRIRNAITWECQCDCGNKTNANTQDLMNGIKGSCGCLQKQNAKKVGISNRIEKSMSGLNAKYRSYKHRAKQLKIDFNLSKDFFKEITSKNCYYCNKEPSQSGTNASRTLDGATHSKYIYNGIDRVDNSKGYIYENVVPCCKVCNYAKNTLSLKEFTDWIKSAYTNLFGVSN